MSNLLKDNKVYRLFFEQTNDPIALVELDQTGKNECTLKFLPNPALSGLLDLNKNQQTEKFSFSAFSPFFSNDVVRRIEEDCMKSIKFSHLQKEYASKKTKRIFKFRYLVLTENILSLVIHDITKNKKISKDKETAEESAGLKQAFVADVSHEIRTPLNSIIGFTDMLLDSMQDADDRKIIQTIQKSGKQLLHLINDLVDLSKIEEGKITVDKNAVNLELFMENIKEQFEGYRRNEYKLDVDFYLKLPGYLRKKIILVDEYRLHQVLSNLLSNAFKFTTEGEIILGLEEEDGQLIFSVKDTGSGISKEDQEAIFERFRQSPNLKKVHQRGTGLGLTISKGLIGLMEGDIWLESEKDKGSTFYFSIPMQESLMDSAPEKEMEDTTRVPDLGGKRILIAEDDVYSLEMLSFLVRATGAEILFAEDGEQAMDLFKKSSFDLALLDIRLPKITGYELVKKMKAINPDIIVVAQTAYALSEDIRTFKKKGFDEYLTKPINPELLYSALRKYLL